MFVLERIFDDIYLSLGQRFILRQESYRSHYLCEIYGFGGNLYTAKMLWVKGYGSNTYNTGMIDFSIYLTKEGRSVAWWMPNSSPWERDDTSYEIVGLDVPIPDDLSPEAAIDFVIHNL